MIGVYLVDCDDHYDAYDKSDGVHIKSCSKEICFTMAEAADYMNSFGNIVVIRVFDSYDSYRRKMVMYEIATSQYTYIPQSTEDTTMEEDTDTIKHFDLVKVSKLEFAPTMIVTSINKTNNNTHCEWFSEDGKPQHASYSMKILEKVE